MDLERDGRVETRGLAALRHDVRRHEVDPRTDIGKRIRDVVRGGHGPQ